ncbi:MAG: zinc ribbon domain-containing protein [Clostridia bacterium]|nr:zinc ribbon domain-containing protein [Clostridia bacterium]
MWFLTFLLVVLLDCVVFGVPVLVYRFAIRKGEPIQDPKKAFFINLAFFCAGTVALVIFNALCGVYEDPDYRFQLGIVDLAFMGLDYYLLTFKRKSEPAQSKPKCAKCGAPLSPNAKFCTECGEKYVPKPVVNTMICPGCGKTIKSTNFCPECGANTAQKKEEKDEIPRDPTFHEMFGDDYKVKDIKSKYKATSDYDKTDDVTTSIFIFILMVVVVFAVIIAILMWLLN